MRATLTRRGPAVQCRRRGGPGRADGVLRSNLRFGLADGVGYSLMVGFGETYLAAFALALGFSEVFTGLLATLPLFAGALLQLASPRGVARLRSRQAWVILCAALQTVSFLPLIAAALAGRASPWLLLAAAALYWGANFATGPAWTAWMESVVPRRIRTGYFARRAGFTQLAVILAVLVGGSALEAGRSRDAVLLAFALTFALAAASRLLSLGMLSRQTEPERPGARLPEAGLRAAWRYARARTQGSFLLYLLLIQMAVSISGPFFAPYMLRRLGMPYSEYMALLAAAFLAKVTVLLLGSRLASTLGARRLLRIGGIGIVPVAALWLVSASFPYLVVIQVFSGLQWACYELGMFLMVFERIRVEERTAVMTLYNVAHALSSVGGSLIGAGLLAWSAAPARGGFAWPEPAGPYGLLFAVSSIARALAVPLLLLLDATPAGIRAIVIRTIAVRTTSGGMVRPLLVSRGRGRDREGRR